MGKNTTLGGQQSFFVKQNSSGKHDLVVTTYTDGNSDFALAALKNMQTDAVTVVIPSGGGHELNNGSGSVVQETYNIIEYNVPLSALSSSDGMLKGTVGSSSTMVTFSIAQMVYIKYVAGTGGSPGSVVIGVVDLESY